MILWFLMDGAPPALLRHPGSFCAACADTIVSLCGHQKTVVRLLFMCGQCGNVYLLVRKLLNRCAAIFCMVFVHVFVSISSFMMPSIFSLFQDFLWTLPPIGTLIALGIIYTDHASFIMFISPHASPESLFLSLSFQFQIFVPINTCKYVHTIF